ncbi:MAG: hypothetical protein N0C81_06900 [Candidatus Thiodiazotropha lotti]|uniref:Uncharacterized protein n=1 Tax=Candidatus Thiodiazotropha lotti TaxID=2792787 RepID=A0A9E4K2Y2_9GAMM|nr:hypothetical protein [Candidatus Thiodiazotropha lotti]MCG7920412.1 hypothetical protein [Candidatus Thiodiazotropha lotti]MCG7931346.1 hypothetical protein [Candidatus Thiodiazotropha lotti]MCG7938667.1 hypothetical protein [Candidatus Thiodiazotropha lotti]MCG7988022.1 hypothetical protein [Candidatus Thiodiazotropha lotti]
MPIDKMGTGLELNQATEINQNRYSEVIFPMPVWDRVQQSIDMRYSGAAVD